MKKLIGLMFYFVVGSASAVPILLNGSLTDTIDNGGVPSGWNIISPSPDTMDENSNVGFAGNGFFLATPSASPDGSTWVGMASLSGTLESFGQVVTGFSIGFSYDLSWYHANFGYDFGFTEANAIQVLVDGNIIGNGAVLPIGTGWFNEMLSFTATSTSHQIEFRALFEDSSYQSIDGIRLSESNISTIPNPAIFGLFIFGLTLIAFKSNFTK